MPAFWLQLVRQRWVWELAIVASLGLVVIFQSHRIDQWRGMVSQLEVDGLLAEKNHEIEEQAKALTQLRALMVSQEVAVADATRTIERLRKDRPSLDRVMARMKEKAVRDEELVAEALRVLGVPVRLAKRCE